MDKLTETEVSTLMRFKLKADSYIKWANFKLRSNGYDKDFTLEETKDSFIVTFVPADLPIYLDKKES